MDSEGGQPRYGFAPGTDFRRRLDRSHRWSILAVIAGAGQVRVAGRKLSLAWRARMVGSSSRRALCAFGALKATRPLPSSLLGKSVGSATADRSSRLSVETAKGHERVEHDQHGAGRRDGLAMASTWTGIRRLVCDAGQVHGPRRVGAGRSQAAASACCSDRPRTSAGRRPARRGPGGRPIETFAAMSNDIRLFSGAPRSPVKDGELAERDCGPARTNARRRPRVGPGARTPTHRGTGRVAPVRRRSAGGSEARTNPLGSGPTGATMASNAHPERQARGRCPSSSGWSASGGSQSSCGRDRALRAGSSPTCWSLGDGRARS